MKIKIKYYRQGIPYITDRSFPTEESAKAISICTWDDIIHLMCRTS